MTSSVIWRKDFPVLANTKEKLVYLDSASTSLKPKHVIESITQFYETLSSNVHRSTHLLSEGASYAFNSSREKVASFINAKPNEVIFTYNSTDSINMVASGLGLKVNDEVIVSILEHHSNFVPWKMQSNVKVVCTDEFGIIDLDELKKSINNQTKLISITYVSNVTGNIQPIKAISKIARENNVLLLIDAAQAVGHIPIDVYDIDCDFMTFSSHKMLGPSGVGVLYINEAMQTRLRPNRFGGGMVGKVFSNEIQLNSVPSLYEAGTPNVEGVIGLGAAIDYLNCLGVENVFNHLIELDRYFKKKLHACDLLKSPFHFGENHSPTFSVLPINSRSDLTFIAGLLSDSYKIAIRSGFHCAQPLHTNNHLNFGTLRVSLYLYNTKDDIDLFFDAIDSIRYLIC